MSKTRRSDDGLLKDNDPELYGTVEHSEAQTETPRSVMVSFILMTVCFALNHGTVTASIPLASGEFGTQLGNYSLGTLYLFYTLTAMLCATAIVQLTGHKWSLFLGCAGYSLYVASYLIGHEISDTAKWAAVLLGSALGGISAGFLWTAQGGYFATCAKWRATLTGKPLSEATAFLSGVFATVYLALELVIKLLSSLIQVWVCSSAWHGDILVGKCHDDDLKHRGQLVVFIVFTAVAVASSLGMAVIRSVQPPKDEAAHIEEQRKKVWYRKAFIAVELFIKDTKMPMLMFYNFAFGFQGAFLNTYVTGTVIKEHLGNDKVGYFVSIIPLVATIMSTPLGLLSRKVGTNAPGMVFGGLCFLTFSTSFLIFSEDTLGKWAALGPLFVIYGMARASWEGPMKAVFANMFKDNSDAAFANVILQLGSASTAAFFMGAGGVSHTVILWFAEVFAVLGVICYVGAEYLHRGEMNYTEVQPDITSVDGHSEP